MTFALLLVLLLGFMGLAIDFGHLFVVKTELQTAMDSCALAAAQELDGQPDAITRATNAGISAGNINRVNLQSSTWSGQPQLTAQDISFLDSDHINTTENSKARFVRCDHTQAGTGTPLLHVLSTQYSSSAYAATIDVRAYAEASTTPAQSTCPLPLALKKNTVNAGKYPPFGYQKGDWASLLIGQSTETGGDIGWVDLTEGSGGGTPDLVAQLQGNCPQGIRTDDPMITGDSGVKNPVSEEWNARFGLYKKAGDITTDLPDYTGYGYTTANWTYKDELNKPCCAFLKHDGSIQPNGFQSRRQAFDTCNGTAQSSPVKTCANLLGIKLSANLNVVASGGPGGQLRLLGTNRRIAPVAVVGAALPSKVIGFACMLMLQPMPSPDSKTQVNLEYLGDASDAGSPCTASGLAGGKAGPLVPVLVR